MHLGIPFSLAHPASHSPYISISLGSPLLTERLVVELSRALAQLSAQDLSQEM